MTKSSSEKQIINYSTWQLIKDVAQFIKPYKKGFVWASVIRLIGDLVWLYPAYLFAYTVTFLANYKGGSLKSLWWVIGFGFLSIILRNICMYISKRIGYTVGEKVAIDSTLHTVHHMFRLDMGWHEKENSGNKIKRIQNAAEGLNKIIRIWFNNLIEIVVNLVAINIIIAQFDRTILILMLFFLVSYFVISRLMTSKASAASYIVNLQEEEVQGLLFETVSNIRTVKVMSMIQTLYETLVNKTKELVEKLRKRIFWYQTRWFFLGIWGGIFKVGIFILIILGIVNDHYEIGFLLLFNTYFGNLRESVDELSNVSVELVSAKLSISRMKTVLKEPVTIENTKGKIDLSVDWKTITFKNVSFSYGDNKVLDDVSFTISRGERIGIVGLSGAGKSTLFKLLLKEREGFEGDILFDDISIKKVKSDSYFKQVSVVLQDTEVFNFSLKENIIITNASQSTNVALLNKSLEIAHISDLVSKLPNGLETVIGEKGVKLSGGERQRLGIARAIFKEPQILLLDEATSSLDLESEEKIRDSLHTFFEKVTAIVIAHRLTTIKEMDRILVLEEGKIIESGNFEALHSTHGRFYELWEKQKL